MGALDRVMLAAQDAGAHADLLEGCPWYRAVSKGEGAADPDAYCIPGKGRAKFAKLARESGQVQSRHGSQSTDGLVALTPRTPEASTVVQPTVPPGGPGLFHIKGEHLPPYVEHLYRHLVARYGKKRAYGVAIGIVKKWKAGINPGGRHPTRTHPDVRAAAARNIAEWDVSRAKAHARHHG